MAHWEYWLLALLLATDGVMGFLAPALTVSFRDIRKPFAGRASFCSAPRACTARRRRLGTVILGLRAQQAEPNFIKVSMGPGKSDQMLPLGMVSAFKRWIKQGEELRPLYNSDSMGEVRSSAANSIMLHIVPCPCKNHGTHMLRSLPDS